MKRGFRRIIGAVLCLFTAVLVFSPAAAASGTDTGKKLLAITFDDGPSKHTTTLLEALGKRGVKATFFIVGSRANAYISTIERMYDEGHQIANHTFNHTYLTNVSASAVRKEVGDTNTYLRAAGGGSGAGISQPPPDTKGYRSQIWHGRLVRRLGCAADRHDEKGLHKIGAAGVWPGGSK